MTKETMLKLIALARSKNNKMPVLAKNAKMMEEVGEFSMATLFKLGYLPHKNLDEEPISEAADVIICLIDAVSSLYPELNDEELIAKLEEKLILKSQKWDKVMRILAEK